MRYDRKVGVLMTDNTWRVLLQPELPLGYDTKAGVLVAQLAALEAEVARRKAYIEGMQGTECGIKCGGCGALLETEWAFAQHFEVKPFNQFAGHLNLGDCPYTER